MTCNFAPDMARQQPQTKALSTNRYWRNAHRLAALLGLMTLSFHIAVSYMAK